MITLMSPQGHEFAKIAESDLAMFLDEHKLAARKSRILKSHYIVYGREVDQELQELSHRPEVEIRGCQNINELTIRMKEMLRMHGVGVFRPTLKTMRQFFNTSGFLLIMKQLEKSIPYAAVIVPAGNYGGEHVFALRVKELS